MVFAKFIGVFFVSRLISVDISIREYSQSLFSVSSSVSEQDLETITSYSDLIMFSAVAGVFSIILIKAIYLHDSHVKPTLVARLASQNLFDLIKNSYDIYHAAAISLVFLWLSSIITLINALMGYTFVWLPAVTIPAAIVLSTILLFDVYQEIKNIKNKPGSYNWI
jgi:hypothetical protein